MSRYHSYLNTATSILAAYNGDEPFASFLKKQFAANKKFGSRDRRTIAHLCYCYFRTGNLFPGDTKEDKILKSLFLCSAEPNEILQQLKPEWNENSALSPVEKYTLLSTPGSIEDIFPWADLSIDIDKKAFAKSFLIQPDLFLRIRPGYEQQIMQKFKENDISFSKISDSGVSLPNATKIEDVIELNKEAVVQDLSSQRIAEFLKLVRPGRSDQPLSVWDCCAASGGKSIMTYDLDPTIDLTVSDIRESILINLKKRFETAGIKRYRSYVADLGHSPLTIDHSPFDLIIADVPCTGSGTWSRTPEQLYFFEEKKIGHYAELQKKIIGNIVRSLKPGGSLLYITCSVFKRENEEIIAHIEKEFHLQKMKMESLIGYDKKADTMFAALLRSAL